VRRKRVCGVASLGYQEKWSRGRRVPETLFLEVGDKLCYRRCHDKKTRENAVLG
jgi:hypothetical protein